MAQDLFEANEVVLGKTYGWYNIQNQRFCGKFKGIKATAKGIVLMMEHKKEIIEVLETPGRFPIPLTELNIKA